MHFIKKFLKNCLIILIIALIVFSVYRYYVLKKDGKLGDVFAKTETTQNDYNIHLENSNNISDSKTSSDKEEKEVNQENTSGEKFCCRREKL